MNNARAERLEIIASSNINNREFYLLNKQTCGVLVSVPLSLHNVPILPSRFYGP